MSGRAAAQLDRFLKYSQVLSILKLQYHESFAELSLVKVSSYYSCFIWIINMESKVQVVILSKGV